MPRTKTDSTPPRALSDAGFSSIKVVSELTTLPMGTLRAWERRYGFPKPARRPGSNRRLYSSEQVERLRRIARVLEHGYRPSDVVHLSVFELASLLEQQAPRSSGVVADVPKLLELLMQDDVRGIEDELRLAAAALGARRFVTDLAHPLALEVGQAWAQGKLAIRQEHLMTECLTTQLRSLLATQQVVEGSPTIVLTTLPGEPHTLGLQMVALYVALGAAKPRLLGASTPPEQVVAAARALDAGVVGIALTPAANLPEAQRDLQRLARGLPAGVALWVGGAGAAALERVPSRVEQVQSWSAIDAALARARRPS